LGAARQVKGYIATPFFPVDEVTDEVIYLPPLYIFYC
jgi:hypothetical protein